jgi:hypothetical protein
MDHSDAFMVCMNTKLAGVVVDQLRSIALLAHSFLMQ